MCIRDSFLNIMNEGYLRDLSRKQKTAIRVKGESGKPTTNRAIYVYKKDPENKYHLSLIHIYHTAARGQSKKLQLMNIIKDCMRHASNREEFIALIESEGYKVCLLYTSPCFRPAAEKKGILCTGGGRGTCCRGAGRKQGRDVYKRQR